MNDRVSFRYHIVQMRVVLPYIESLRAYQAGRAIEEVRRKYGVSRVVKLASNGKEAICGK